MRFEPRREHGVFRGPKRLADGEFFRAQRGAPGRGGGGIFDRRAGHAMVVGMKVGMMT